MTVRIDLTHYCVAQYFQPISKEVVEHLTSTSKDRSRRSEVLLPLVRGQQFIYRGSVASSFHHMVIHDALHLWLLLLSDLYESIGLNLTHRMVGRFFRTCNHDIVELLGDIKTADEIVLGMTECDKFTSGAFKAQYRDLGCNPGSIFLVQPLLNKLFTDRSEHLLFCVHQALCFLTRLTLNSKDELMSAEAWETFKSTEDVVRQQPIWSAAKPFFQKYFSGKHVPYDLIPYHSNGAVCDCTNSVGEKYRSCVHDSKTLYMYSHYGIPTLPFSVKEGKLERTVRFQPVPKNAAKFRGITVEPAHLQYLQHAVMSVIDRYVERHRYLRRRIDLHDASLNQKAACYGSIMGSMSTIDLSAASDSVSWSKVKEATQGTWLYPLLLLTRSTHCHFGDEKIELVKYGGMGNATTFRVECLYFAALCELAIVHDGGDVASSRYRVYGDDIVIETEYVQTLKRILEDEGFKVNNDKSFTGTTGPFIYRESCGCEAVNGRNCTPFRLPRNFRGISKSGMLWQPAAIELANEAWSPSVRQCIISNLLANCTAHTLPLFSEDGSSGVRSPEPTNYRLSARYRKDYQAYEFKYGQPRCEKPIGKRDDDVAYFEWLRISRDRSRLQYPEDRIVVATGPSGRVRWSSNRTTILPPRRILG